VSWHLLLVSLWLEVLQCHALLLLLLLLLSLLVLLLLPCNHS
jgi:hypothetical protein